MLPSAEAAEGVEMTKRILQLLDEEGKGKHCEMEHVTKITLKRRDMQKYWKDIKRLKGHS